MIERHVCSADPNVRSDPRPAARLTVTAVLPIWPPNTPIDKFVRERLEFFDEQARKVLDVLDALPGGTRAALLCALLEEERNVLSVSRGSLLKGLSA